MGDTLEQAMQFIEQSGWMAPLFFIVLHMIRQLLFLPVLLVCLLGGYLFGTWYGTIYSMIGLTVSSFIFYVAIDYFPSIKQKLRFVEGYDVSVPQLMIMRIMPFVHFHLVTLYVIETEKEKRKRMKKTIVLSFPPAFVYTAFGDIIHGLPFIGLILLFSMLLILMLYFRSPKEKTIRWNDFFAK